MTDKYRIYQRVPCGCGRMEPGHVKVVPATDLTTSHVRRMLAIVAYLDEWWHEANQSDHSVGVFEIGKCPLCDEAITGEHPHEDQCPFGYVGELADSLKGVEL